MTAQAAYELHLAGLFMLAVVIGVPTVGLIVSIVQYIRASR